MKIGEIWIMKPNVFTYYNKLELCFNNPKEIDSIENTKVEILEIEHIASDNDDIITFMWLYSKNISELSRIEFIEDYEKLY